MIFCQGIPPIPGSDAKVPTCGRRTGHKDRGQQDDDYQDCSRSLYSVLLWPGAPQVGLMMQSGLLRWRSTSQTSPLQNLYVPSDG